MSGIQEVSGVHDVGGTPGLGAVEAEPDEPVFHEAWERRVLALHVALGLTREWTLDQVRAARESRPPHEFTAMSYYETFLGAIERLVTDHGLATAEELAAGRSLQPPTRTVRALGPADVAGAVGRGNPPLREAPRPARFQAGDPVRASVRRSATHTRLPGYVRGRLGTVTLVHGCHAFPDTRALGLGDDPQWLYAVRFDARELWGPDADPTQSVSVDAFEPYLEPAP